MKRSVSIADEQSHIAIASIHDGEIRIAIRIEMAHRDGERVLTHGERCGRESARAVTEQNENLVSIEIDGGDILIAVPIEIADCQRNEVSTESDARELREAALPVSGQ